ncbi:BREX system Lon protease-like protein BrxL [Methylotuvimicrobium buryatense]|uniref:BREX system Lon protease-like protein BrxL n=1 Tax=Methylotuvimicrobium buryatense TaxID=95641 RepID=A0A4P9UPF3_METBY|nr:BREX system Lon protease-like protein BrxL [Methylotuvimicrobium buryatense]QCW82111.1 BREX system Lon protease-like protein BrxL [Methylotuvimicrobium buryatense]
MNKEDLDEKIRANFAELVIDKALVRRLKIRENRAIPSFVEEWLIARFQEPEKTDSEIYQAITGFMSKHLPTKTEKDKLKRLLQRGESLVLLDRFEVQIDIKNNKQRVTIPSLDETQASVTHEVLDNNESLLEGGQWGAGRLILRDDGKDKKVIELIEFNPMQSGKVNLQQLIKARQQFTTQEWIAFILRAMGYEPCTYSDNEQTNLILRLLPMLQNNLNMMELAPKGTGKSFIFSNLSRYVYLNSGGGLTPAQLFKNLNTKVVGLLAKNDVLVLDEGQSISFKGADDIQAKFKDYLESGHYTIGGDKITSDCGLMILANIDLYESKPRRTDYIRHLPEMFHESALLDRFHGFIAGWEIPRFVTGNAAQGLGMKADVFGEYLHQLRTVSTTEFPFGQCPIFSKDSDIRDVKAVTRLATALSKLLLINPDHSDYEAYVLTPAKELRQRVRSQLAELDPHEFASELKVYV